MVIIYIKQHLSNIWITVYEKVKQHWDLVEKKRCLYQKTLNKFQLSFWCGIILVALLWTLNKFPTSFWCDITLVFLLLTLKKQLWYKSDSSTGSREHRCCFTEHLLWRLLLLFSKSSCKPLLAIWPLAYWQSKNSKIPKSFFFFRGIWIYPRGVCRPY